MKKQIDFRFFLFFSLFVFFPLFSASAQNANPIIFQEIFEKDKVLSIFAKLSYEQIEIKPIYGDKVLVEMTGNNSKILPLVQLKDDALQINTRNLRFTKGNSCFIHIYVPKETFFQSIQLFSDSGDINADSVFASSKIIASTKNGQIRVKNLTAAEVQLLSQKAKVNAENILCEYFCAENADADILAKLVQADYFSLKNDGGGINIVLKDAPTAKSSVQTNGGGITVHIPKESSFLARVTSASGLFSSDFLNGEPFIPKNFILEHSKGAEIELSSLQGKIWLGD